ncbi:MAG: 3-dehydroquinate synthase, partial [Candidatus Ancillula sp.]|nr:3-dehydroquinate synthase [Candidatus Ancillula sp.]
GGAVTDLAGFLASTYLRGIRFINCPTSLLAMVDASVGGKTGINLKSGKNLCGSFYSPNSVLINPVYLKTLNRREYIEGLAEVIKMGLVFEPKILDLINDFSSVDEAISGIGVTDLIFLATKRKAEIVSKDFKESGLRMLLNYGHTFGHAVEKIENFKFRHGEGVAIGMIFAAELAYDLGLLDQEILDLHYFLLNKVGLPVSWNTSSSFDEVLDVMMKDKKVINGNLRFVLLTELQQPEIVTIEDKNVLKNVFERITK